MRWRRSLRLSGNSGRNPTKSRSKRSFLLRPVIEALEPRVLLSSSTVNVLSYHDDSSDTGQDLSETVLTPTDVNSSDFAKLDTVTLDGQVYAQPLYVQNVDINLTSGATNGSSTNDGIHSVIYAATQNDSLYAIDANTGTILWQDSFLNTTNPTDLTATTGVTAIPADDVVDSNDVNPEIGIVSTPTISLNSNDGGEIYVNAATKEVSGGNTYFVQRLWEIDITTGAVTNKVVIGDTEFNSTNFSGYSGYEYVAGPVIAGTGNDPGSTNGDGWVANPSSIPEPDNPSVNVTNYNPQVANSGYSHPQQIAFNALLEMQRTAMSLINGTLYLGFASHGDEGPYYGWILGYNATTLQLTAVFNTAPTYEPYSVVGGDRTAYTAQAGIWDGGGPIISDGAYLYVTIGNGAFNPNPSNFSSLGSLPLDSDYGDSVLKLTVDTTHTGPSTESANGWGLKVVDYFTPSNVYEMNNGDLDLGSSGIVLVDGGSELVAAGKEGRIYLIDTQTGDMGEYNYNYIIDGYEDTDQDPRPFDRVLGEYPVNGTTVNSSAHQAYGTGAYFDGNIYYAMQNHTGLEFSLSTFAYPHGQGDPYANGSSGAYYVPPISSTTSTTFGSRGSIFSISANGTSNAIAWSLDVSPGSSDTLVAYSATNLGDLLYQSPTSGPGSLAGGVTNATGTKFSVPTVANGLVYAGTSSASGSGNDSTGTGGLGTIAIFGLLSSYLTSNSAFFDAPSNMKVSVSSSSPTDAQLVWTSNSTLASEFEIQRSTTGTGNWSTIAYVTGATTSYSDTTISSGTQYYYRVIGVNGSNTTAASNTAQILVLTPVAGANPNPVTGTTSNLSVQGTSGGSYGTLTYAWSVISKPSGAGTPTFSVNGTNAAQNTTVTFTQAGNYTFMVAVIDSTGDSVTTSVNVTVNQTLTGLNVTPVIPSLSWNATQQFTATGYDQFGNAMTIEPAFTWSVTSGGGSINSSGLYTAPAANTTATVQAANGAISNSATVTVANTAPSLIEAASASPNPVTGTSTNLSVEGSDTDGEGNNTLTYTWSVTAEPAGANTPTFSVNGTNAAQNTTATFYEAGSYTFLATITDNDNVSTTSSITVTVNQTLSSISVSPSNPTINVSSTQQFSATGYDQFGNALATQPTFTWSVPNGGGTISSSGLYTAPSSSGMAIVQAASGSVQGSTMVTAGSAPTLVSVVSYKQQGDGSYGITLGMGDTPTVEDRVDGPTDMVLTFNTSVVLGSNFSLTLSSGAGYAVASGETVTITMTTYATNGQTLVVGLNDVADANTGLIGDYSFDVGVLFGNASGSGTVNAGDLDNVVRNLGAVVNATNFMYDIGCFGSINAADLDDMVRSLGSTLTLPPPSGGPLEGSVVESPDLTTPSGQTDSNGLIQTEGSTDTNTANTGGATGGNTVSGAEGNNTTGGTKKGKTLDVSVHTHVLVNTGGNNLNNTPLDMPPDTASGDPTLLDKNLFSNWFVWLK